MNPFDLIISPEQAGLRIDRVLSLLPQVESRSRAAALINAGHVTLNQRAVKSSHITKAGECFRIDIPAPEPSDLQPLDLPLDIVFEDETLLVINKPAGLVVHPAAGHRTDTLVNALLHHTEQLSRGAPGRPGIVHRLDKETSGLLVVAKTDSAHRHLAAQFKERTIHRLYWAVVFGKPTKARDRIESFLRRHPNDRKRFASEKPTPGRLPGGKRAITHYEFRSSHGGASLLHCRLETGRTHQIRVHLSELGHPILGDLTYGSGRRLKHLTGQKLRAQVSVMSRIALHAAELGFVHPVTNTQLSFQCPWPADLQFLAEEFGP